MFFLFLYITNSEPNSYNTLDFNENNIFSRWQNQSFKSYSVAGRVPKQIKALHQF
jgi:hypothetical protein